MKTSKAFLPATTLTILFLFCMCRRDIGEFTITGSHLDSVRTEILFDEGWLFYRGDAEEAWRPEFDDSGWRLLDLPHDWSIEDIPGTGSPFDSNAVGGIDAGYLVGGTAWYRKEFNVPADLKDKQFMIQFDGIYMNADIWMNGIHLINHPYGYTSFRYYITPHLLPGKKNCLAVRVRNEGRNSRWYSGSGIYRHVWLKIISQVHADPWALSIRTPAIDSSAPKVNLEAGFFNSSGTPQQVKAVIKIMDPLNKKSGEAERVFTVNPGSSYYYRTAIPISDLYLWTPETPHLYKADIELLSVSASGHESPFDRITNTFGFRTVEANAENGFLLNGKPVLLKGGCIHHDNGPLGAAAFDRAEERRVELMKASGFNAVRSSHNPPSPALLDACDRIGMMVIDEAFDMWREPKNPDDYHKWFNEWWRNDLENMLRRDGNHPSVIMWSIGNEIPERGKPEGARMAMEMRNIVRMYDRSRPVTSAVNSLGPDKDPFFSMLDISGYNYAVDHYVADHKRLPERIILSTESFPLEAFRYWMAVKDYPWVIGDFVWTGFDYLGEASIGWLGYPHEGSFYPWNHAFCGDLDICGFKRPQSFYRDILWKDEKNVYLFVKPPSPSFPVNTAKAEWSKWEWQDVVSSWNWDGHEGKPLQVEVYSNSDEVELVLNGRSLGRKKTDRSTEFIARWEFNYEPGILAAKGYSSAGEVAAAELRTAGKPSKIRLTADRTSLRADNHDLSYVTVEITDENGFRIPTAENLVSFSIEGPGELISAGSSNPVSTESFKKPFRKAWQGRCLAIIKAGRKTGTVRFSATAEGIQRSGITITVNE